MLKSVILSIMITLFATSALAATTCHSRGKGTVWLGDGRLQYRCTYHNNGQLSTETPYVDKIKHGTRWTFSREGNVESKIDYWNGHLRKERWYTKSGKMRVCKKYDENFRYLGSCM